MLGGINHAAAYLRAHTGTPSVMLGAGPLLFSDPKLSPERRSQDLWKAEALLRSFGEMGLKAWAPGANDFAAGPAELNRLSEAGPIPLARNLRVDTLALAPQVVFTVGAVKVGLAGVSVPKHLGELPEAVHAEDSLVALRAAAHELGQQGAQLKVALVALPRGEAMRLAELVPEFQLMLVGKSSDEGDANDAPSPPSEVGHTLVVEAPNHLQAFYVVDFFVRDQTFVFANADAAGERRRELATRIAELEHRISVAEQAGSATAADIGARRADLARLQADLRALGQRDQLPAGSYFRAELVEVREKLGVDPKVQARLSDYYKRVNDYNRDAFKDKRPKDVAAGQSAFVGAEKCASCHKSEFAFWKTTRHAAAYVSLSRQFKEFNLDCVGCHVTGYEQAGGSTVTHVDELKDVQCEVCHGPASRHLADPSDSKLIVSKPEITLCAAKCHHPPHVKSDWTASAAFSHIVGPGHGG
jgi:hypothetical protein